MKAIYDTWLIQIEITNVCNHICTHCTRFVGHHKNTYFMSIDEFEKALDSLEGYPGGIGIMGGEPAMHPKFKEICEIFRKRVPAPKRYLWTSGYRWDEYRDIIRKTFAERIYLNDHADETQTHQPVLIAIEDVIDDRELMRELIDKCWIQEKWSPSINPKGGFFCEVAAAMAMLFDDGSGYKLEKDWWKKSPGDFNDQIEKYCYKCSAALPLPPISNHEAKDLVSPSNYKRLKKVRSPKLLKDRVIIYDKKMTREEVEELLKTWKPWEYLGEEGKIGYLKMYGFPGGLLVTLGKKYRKRVRKIKKALGLIKDNEL